MLPLVVLFSLSIAAASAVPTNQQRIVGGSLTNISQYPNLVALLFSSNMNAWVQRCGGIIINNRHILTAAHCLRGHAVSRWRTRVGSTFANSGGSVINSQRFTIHANFNPTTRNNDIAVLRLNAAIILGNNARRATFAGANYILRDNQNVMAAGWGRLSTNGSPSAQLRHVQVRTVNQANCRSRYAAVNTVVTDNMLCAGRIDIGGRDVCQGDFGGPLLHNRVVVGVASWGRGCGAIRFPSVYTRVSRYAAWIRNNS